MWQFASTKPPRPSAQPSPASAQSAYDLLLGMRGATLTIIYLDLSKPDHPVAQVSGIVESVSTSSLVVSLAGPLSLPGSKARFGVELMAGPGILRFQSQAYTQITDGARHVELTLPRQIESVQRRKFTRVTAGMPVAFSCDGSVRSQGTAQSGVGHATNISAGGLSMVTPAQLRAGQSLFISFNTPDGSSYRGLSARVARVSGPPWRQAVALRFSEVPAELEQQLVQTVFRLQIKGHAKR